MKNVYIVTYGEYSGYGIICVFSKEEDANAYVERNNRRASYTYDKMRVEEYPIDDRIELAHNPLTKWGVYIFDDGGKPSVFPFDDWDGYEEVRYVNADETSNGRGQWVITVSARDEEHAVKVARDRFAEYTAEMRGIN